MSMPLIKMGPRTPLNRGAWHSSQSSRKSGNQTNNATNSSEPNPKEVSIVSFCTQTCSPLRPKAQGGPYTWMFKNKMSALVFSMAKNNLKKQVDLRSAEWHFYQRNKTIQSVFDISTERGPISAFLKLDAKALVNVWQGDRASVHLV